MRVARLLLGLCLLFAFAALMAWGPTLGGVMRNNLVHGIDATALFYTEVDELSSVERARE